MDGAGHGGLVASFIEMLGFFVGKVPSRHSEYQKKKSFVKVKNWHINITDSQKKCQVSFLVNQNQDFAWFD